MPQNYSNHTRFDPKFHFFLVPLCVICFVASILHVMHAATPANVLLVPVTFALLFIALIARMYAIRVQDRVIRMEESLRYQRLGVSATDLSQRQIIALRFAADAELPQLAARAATENLSAKQIKQTIGEWRADEHRV